MGVKILHGPDLHAIQTDPSGELRAEEWRAGADSLSALGGVVGVRYALYGGDLNDNRRPMPIEELAVSDLFQQHEKQGIQVVGMPGNHDPRLGDRPSPGEVVARTGYPSRWCVAEPAVVELEDVSVACLPWCKPSSLLVERANPAEAVAIVTDKLLEIARGLRAQCPENKPAVLLSHWMVSGSKMSSGQTIFAGNEVVLPLAGLIDCGFNAYFLNHVHRPQILSQKPWVAYSGALLRKNFGEADDDRGAWIYDLDEGVGQFHKIAARRFVTIDWTEKDVEDILVHGVGSRLSAVDVTDAYVKVRYQCTGEQARKMDSVAIYDALKKMKPYLIAGIVPEIRHTDAPAAEIHVTEHLGVVDSVSAWLKQRSDVSDTLKAKALDRVRAMVKEGA